VNYFPSLAPTARVQQLLHFCSLDDTRMIASAFVGKRVMTAENSNVIANQFQFQSFPNNKSSTALAADVGPRNGLDALLARRLALRLSTKEGWNL